jgi:hypothetical protein
MSYEALGAQVFSASELGSRIQPWWNVRAITPHGETGPLQRYPRRFSTPVDGGTAHPVVTFYGRKIGPQGATGPVIPLGDETRTESLPLYVKIIAGIGATYLAYLILLKPIKENPKTEEVYGVKLNIPGNKLGRTQRRALTEIMQSGLKGISYRNALGLRGSAKNYEGRYIGSVRNVVDLNPEYFEEGHFGGSSRGLTVRFIGGPDPDTVKILKTMKAREKKLDIVTPFILEQLETAWKNWVKSVEAVRKTGWSTWSAWPTTMRWAPKEIIEEQKASEAYYTALKTANDWIRAHWCGEK